MPIITAVINLKFSFYSFYPFFRRHKHHIGNRYIEVYKATGEDFMDVAGGEWRHNIISQSAFADGPNDQSGIEMRGHNNRSGIEFNRGWRLLRCQIWLIWRPIICQGSLSCPPIRCWRWLPWRPTSNRDWLNKFTWWPINNRGWVSWWLLRRWNKL